MINSKLAYNTGSKTDATVFLRFLALNLKLYKCVNYVALT